MSVEFFGIKNKNGVAPNLILLLAAICIQGCGEQKHDSRAEDGPQRPAPSAAAAEDAYKKRSLEFPTDFPLPKYPNSELEASELKLSDKPAHTVILTSRDDVPTVSHYYFKALKQGGWDIGKVINNKTYMMLTASKDGQEANVMVSETRTGITAISLYSNKK